MTDFQPKIIGILLTTSLYFFTGCKDQAQGLNTGYLQYIDTRVGTAASITKQAGRFGKGSEEYAQTLPAVLEPNGMNFWTPQTRETEQKCIAPYYHADTLLQGFRNSHWIVGGCTQDYGSMTLMPVSKELTCLPRERSSRFSHDSEIATPAYYSVDLDRYNIKAEMTGTSRSAIFRFTYFDDDAYLVVNPNSDRGEGYIEIDTVKKEIRGYNPVHRIYQGWGEKAGFNGYFVIRFENEIVSYGTFGDKDVFEKQAQISDKKNIGAFVKFRLPANKQILVKAASSFTSMENARLNLDTEIPDWNFAAVQTQLEKKWEKTLSAIQVETSDITDKRKFYSALYRASFLPRTFNDVNGSYPTFSKVSLFKK